MDDVFKQIELEGRMQRFFDKTFGEGTRLSFGWKGETFEELADKARKVDENRWWKEHSGKPLTDASRAPVPAAKTASSRRKRT